VQTVNAVPRRIDGVVGIRQKDVGNIISQSIRTASSSSRSCIDFRDIYAAGEKPAANRRKQQKPRRRSRAGLQQDVIRLLDQGEPARNNRDPADRARSNQGEFSHKSNRLGRAKLVNARLLV